MDWFQGILRALYTLPEKSMGVTDVRKAGNNGMINTMKAVEAALAQGEKICNDHQLEGSSRLHAIGQFSVNLILGALKKTHKSIEKIESVDDAGVLFVEHVRELTGNANIACPWVKTPPSGAAGAARKVAASAQPKSSSFLDYTI